ncbi:MAG: winged helix-turn-helix transcriptional regulator [Cyanobacteria bacterium]|nr:winged helix-turn-helix transcriptional regulator [Cyanobacteriota bacterium]
MPPPPSATYETSRDPRMLALIRQAEASLVRRRFATTAELIAGLYAALVQWLDDRQLIRSGPFDASTCPQASLADLDAERMGWFIDRARQVRGFPLPPNASASELLTHLNLLSHGQPTHAAVLLFGRQPQRFLLSSELKAAHFHGTAVAKPIPSYQVFKGTVFELVDQAVDFVLARLSFAVGTRAATTQAPAAYEIPPEVIREAIVNAVAHPDYTSNGSVQVMVFADRVEIWNPGSLPPSLSLAQLRQPHGSIPANPLLAERLYLTQYIERLGTGTGDMIRRCRETDLPEPEFSLEDGFRISLGRPLPVPSSSVTTEETEEETKEERRDAGGQGAATDRTTIRRDQILVQLRANPQVTIDELARLLNLPDNGVEYNLRKFRQDGRIRREDSTKAGRWVVLSPPEG